MKLVKGEGGGGVEGEDIKLGFPAQLNTSPQGINFVDGQSISTKCG